MTQVIENQAGTWRELLGPRHAGTSVVLAGGVLLYASNVYLTTSLLPTAVADIGGAHLYAWSMTAFLIASVISSMLVSRVLATRGGVAAYLIGLGLFAAGSLVCALSPSMPVLLVGRGVQGLGGGLISGLGFALIHSALPRRLWARGAALMSGMWGVGNFAGPAIGGLFAQFDAWRAAFGLLVVAAVLIAVLVPRVLPRGDGDGSGRAPVPVASLLLLTAATAAVSVAGIVPKGVATAAAIVVGLAFVVLFLARERRGEVRVLPKTVFARRSPLKWVYVTIAFLALGVGTETFIPLFGQRLGDLPPLAAGFLGAALSLGWSLTQIASSTAVAPAAVRLLRVGGPAVLAAGLAGYGLLQRADAGWLLIVCWVVVLFVGGAGIGMAFPHLSVAAMASTSDPDEGKKAAAGINTVLLIANAFATALAGVLVSLGEPSIVRSAQYLLFGFAILAVLGTLTSQRVSTSDQASD